MDKSRQINISAHFIEMVKNTQCELLLFLTSILFKTCTTIPFEICKLHSSILKDKTNYGKRQKQKSQSKKQVYNNQHLTLINPKRYHLKMFLHRKIFRRNESQSKKIWWRWGTTLRSWCPRDSPFDLSSDNRLPGPSCPMR